MDLYNSCVILLLLAQTGFCSGDELDMPAQLSGVRGKSVNFTASVPPSTEIDTVTWSFIPKGGSSVIVCTAKKLYAKLSPPYLGRANYSLDTYTLLLTALTPADAGTYTLGIVDATLNPLLGQTELIVLDPVVDVSITSSVPEAVEINSTVALTCAAKGSSLSYSWMNNSVPVVVDGTHIMQNGSQLIINRVYRTDLLGPITCTARNQLESSTSAAFNLTVNYGPELVRQTQDPPANNLKKGSNLTFTCSAKSSPPADFIWLHDGAELPQKTAVIVFSSLGVEQSGNYSCMAYNSKTLRYVSSDASTVSVIEPISGTNITGPNFNLIAGNSTVNLTCTASTGQADQVLWFKDGRPLENARHITYNTDKSTVTMSPVQKDDTGLYRCQLKNKISSDESNYKMVVFYGPDNVVIKADKKGTVGQTLMMNCSYASLPPPTFVWKFNGSVLVGETSLCYIIQILDHTHSGMYTCEATNTVTGLTTSANHNLIVKDAGEPDTEGLSGGAIAGIVIAVLLVLAIIIGCCIQKRRKISDIPSPY